MSGERGEHPPGAGATFVDPAAMDLELADRIERASVQGWCPTFVEELPDGWILRATPGLDRGRACHALTPRTRMLDDGELPFALERVRAWSAVHGIRGGLQVSPLELHGDIVPGLVAAGWAPVWKVWVMAADRVDALERGARRLAAGAASAAPVGSAGAWDGAAGAWDGAAGAWDGAPWISSRRPDEAWLATWDACQPKLTREVIDAHATTVFTNVGERGVFGRLGDHAAGVAVEDASGEWAGLFSLVVRPGLRGRGLGRRLCLSLIEEVSAPRVYLQVEMTNVVALGLYASLGFRAIHSYQHLQAPHGWAAGG